MALRTGTRADLVTGLHTGPVRLGVAGLADPSGNDFIILNDAGVAPGGIVNALTITTGATGSAVILSSSGLNNGDANAGITIRGAGTGVVTLGSSTSPVTLAGAATLSSALTVTGTISGTSAISLNTGASSSAFTVMTFGLGSTSANARMAIYVGSSYPTPPVGPAPGSLFFNQGGTSSTCLLMAIPNGGTASSSNWTTLSFTVLPS